MSTTMMNAYIAVAKDMGDLYQGTTTGAGTATTLVDAALMGKTNDWVADNVFAILTSEPAGAASIYDERKVSSLDVTTGTLTTLTFAAAPGTGITYNLSRWFTPTKYNEALSFATKTVFPWLHKPILDVSLTITANTPTKDISSLGLAQNQPTSVEFCTAPSVTYPIWTLLRDWECTSAGILYLPQNLPVATLRITGMGYLDFLKTGAVSTAWDSTIAVDEPQFKILSAEAAVYLYKQRVGDFTSGGSKDALERLNFWQSESQRRKATLGMTLPIVRTHWGI
jgi:hypothetical protein